MPHHYNRAAFQTGTVGTNVLLSLYCSFVALELGLKDHFQAGGWRSGHSIIDWVTELGEAALAVQLGNRLAQLQCTAKDGTRAPLDGNKYPDLRYLRHQDDWVGASTDADLRDALSILDDIRLALRRRGVNL